MTKYWRTGIIENGGTADPHAIDQELWEAMSQVNGAIESNNIPHNVLLTSKFATNTFNRYVNKIDPYSTANFYLQIADVTSRDWTFPTETTYQFTADYDGVMTGAYSGTVRCFAQTNVKTPNTNGDYMYGWAVGVFVDGREVGRCDSMWLQGLAVEIPFLAVIQKGDHEIRIGYRTMAYPTSLSTHSADDVMDVMTPAVWWRIAYR